LDEEDKTNHPSRLLAYDLSTIEERKAKNDCQNKMIKSEKCSREVARAGSEKGI
jgi:hypothetical protein